MDRKKLTLSVTPAFYAELDRRARQYGISRMKVLENLLLGEPHEESSIEHGHAADFQDEAIHTEARPRGSGKAARKPADYGAFVRRK